MIRRNYGGPGFPGLQTKIHYQAGAGLQGGLFLSQIDNFHPDIAFRVFG